MVAARVAFLAGHEPPHPPLLWTSYLPIQPGAAAKDAQHLAPNIFQNMGTSLGLVPLRAEAATRKGRGAWRFLGVRSLGCTLRSKTRNQIFEGKGTKEKEAV